MFNNPKKGRPNYIDSKESLSKNQYYSYYKQGKKRGAILYGVLGFMAGIVTGIVLIAIIATNYGG